MAREIIFPGSAGCQLAAFGRRAECNFAKEANIEVSTELIQKDVRGRLPRTTGWQPVCSPERNRLRIRCWTLSVGRWTFAW